MFSEHEWHILGIRRWAADWQFCMSVESGKFGRNVYNHFQDTEPIQQINIQEYDLLIDVAESNHYNPQWRETASNWKIPRIRYITNPCPKTTALRWSERARNLLFKWTQAYLQATESIFQYYNQPNVKGSPIVYTNKQLEHDWGLEGRVIYFSHDEWGIGRWTGEEPIMICGKNGYYSWSKPPKGSRVEQVFAQLFAELGDQFYVHDSSIQPYEEIQWRDFVAKKRLWFEHDFGSTGRAFCQGVVKAMCLGLPVIAWRTKIGQHYRFIDNYWDGLVTDDMHQCVTLAKHLLTDFKAAEEYSHNMIRLYNETLSWAVTKPKWKNAMDEAFVQYEAMA